MSQRQFTTPMIVRGGNANPLSHVDYDDRSFNEDWLQKLLFENPSLLPVGEIEPTCKGILPIGREVPTAAGPIDLLYINPNGFITLVETKLFRNPEARRSVVSQILDYTKELAGWSYNDLVNAVRRVGSKSTGDPLIELVEGASVDFDRDTFRENVSRNLRLGRFLLLIVGDGIREDAERLADFIQDTPHHGYTLALVEIGIYRMAQDQTEPLIVQPRIIARTREITRAVIQFTGIDRTDMKVSGPPIDESRGGKRQKITEEEFFEALAKNVEPSVVEFAHWVLQTAEQHGLQVAYGDAGPLIQYLDDVTGQPFTFGQLNRSGKLTSTGFLSGRCHATGLPSEIARDYIDSVVKLIPGTSRWFELKKFEHKGDGTEWQYFSLVYGMNPKPGDALPLALLAPYKEKWIEVIDNVVVEIRKASEERIAAK